MTDKLENARNQASAQYESIKEMVADLRRSGTQELLEDDARRIIEEDALSVEVRSGWYPPGRRDANMRPAEYCILLCTGGPAVRIVGKLSEYASPETAKIEYQDWFQPWALWNGEGVTDGYGEIEDILLDYARVFYFGE